MSLFPIAIIFAMKTTRMTLLGLFTAAIATAFVSLALCPISASAAEDKGKEQNPKGKVYVASVKGGAKIRVGDKIESLSAKSTYLAEGTLIETDSDSSVSLVFSNGTSVTLEPNTRIEVKQMTQEAFTPTQGDSQVEPSISKMQLVVAFGAVSLSTSQLVAGSSMTVRTSDATVNVRSGSMVIEAAENSTKVSLLTGEATVQAGTTNLGGSAIGPGDQAVVRQGALGQPTAPEVAKIPAPEKTKLDDQVAVATMAKKTVYFAVKEVAPGTTLASGTSGGGTAGTGPETSGAGAQAAAGSTDGRITAFDGNSAPSTASTFASSTPFREIVAVPVVPAQLPVNFTVSPATLPAPGNDGGG